MFEIPSFSIPVFIFYGLFLIYLLGYLLFSLFNLLHLLKFGVAGANLYLTIVIFTVGTVILAVCSVILLMGYDPLYSWSIGDPSSFIQDNVFPGL